MAFYLSDDRKQQIKFNWHYNIFTHAVDHDSLITAIQDVKTLNLRGYWMWKIWSRKSAHFVHALFGPASKFHYWFFSITDTLISILLKDTECLYHEHVQIEPSFSHLLARANHYPGLKLLNCQVQHWKSLSSVSW